MAFAPHAGAAVGGGLNSAMSRKPDALLHHSDRGSHYTSEPFQRLMADHGVTCSMMGLTSNGGVAEAILETAADKGIDLIVMGSRGLGSLNALLVGSVSQKVSHLADCSCISVK